MIEGVINLRGKIIPVMDLRKRFGSTTIQSDKKNRILVVELESRLLGLIVSSASEVLKIPPSEIEPPGDGVCRRRIELCDRSRKIKGAAGDSAGYRAAPAPTGIQKTRGGGGACRNVQVTRLRGCEAPLQ